MDDLLLNNWIVEFFDLMLQAIKIVYRWLRLIFYEIDIIFL